MSNFNGVTDGPAEIVTRGSDTPEAGSVARSAALELRNLKKTKERRSKKLTKLERTRNLHIVVVNLVQELQREGFPSVLAPPGPVAMIGPEIDDPKTLGKIAHAREPLGTYIQRLSVEDNFFQRPPFDHVTDPIYRRLIRDFIEGAVMPESKIAALSWTGGVRNLEARDLRYSIIDGLQRLYCYLIAILLVWRRERLVQEGVMPEEAWNFFAPSVQRLDEPELATEKLLQRVIRYEIFYTISLAGLLHYMVTFNSSQRRMSLRVQLEIMKKPLIEHLKGEGIPIWEDIGKMPGEQRPKDRLLASDIVLATQAFLTHNPHVTTAVETERFLDENQPYLDNIGDISDVITTLKRVSTEVQSKIARCYESDPANRYLMYNGDPFLLGFLAACGYIRSRGGMMILDKALDRFLAELECSDSDPIGLESYRQALAAINASHGKDARRLVDDTFRRFFLGVTTELEWLDTASQMTSASSRRRLA